MFYRFAALSHHVCHAGVPLYSARAFRKKCD